MSSTAPSRLLRAIDSTLKRAKAELPALASILDAFGPIIAAQARIAEAAPGWTGDLPAIDPDRFCQGAFILADSGFQDMSAELPAAARELLPIMAASFPALAGDYETLAQALESGALTAQDLAAAAFGQELQVADADAQAVAFAASELVRPFLRRQARDLFALVKDLPWGRNFCPVCGAAPNMSVLRRVEEDDEFIKSHGGKRFLRCSCCAAEWTHKRVSCPACGCEEPDELMILRDPERPFERADCCKRCKSFVLCLDTGELADAPDPDVTALTMLPLERKARDEGYTPIAGSPWNGL
jgi:FdhE protein